MDHTNLKCIIMEIKKPPFINNLYTIIIAKKKVNLFSFNLIYIAVIVTVHNYLCILFFLFTTTLYIN